MKKIELSLNKKILLLLSTPQKIKAAGLVSLMLVSSLMEIFSLGLLIVIMDFFLEFNAINSNSPIYNFLNNFMIDKENPFILALSLFIVIFLLKIILLVYLSWVESGFVARLKERLSNMLFNNFLNRNAHQILKKNSATYLRNFTVEIQLAMAFYYVVLKLILEIILVLTLFVFLVYFDFLSAVSSFIVLTTLSLLYFFLVKNFISDWGKKRLSAQKKKVQFVNEGFSAIKYIKILSREKYFFKKFKIQNFKLSNITFKMGFVNTLPRFVLESFLFISILGILLVLFKNNYSYPEIVKIVSIYIVVSFRLIPSANRILNSIQSLKYCYPAFITIFNETQIKPSIIKSINNQKIFFKKEILININKFNYSKNSKFFLKNINIKLNRKSKIGIIGASGSGKSTIIDIICGFTKINNGNIFVDKKSIYTNLNSWQKLIGYIPQKIVILNDSLKNNILFGLDKKKYHDKKLTDILKKVELMNFCKKLPNGFNEIISQEGLNISGGEIQRIGIARALINNPEIILLDEATSALDTFTENKILKVIYSLEKTIIFVSHRVNSLKYCDRIYHIDSGKIKDHGNFSKFINKHVVK